MNKNRLKAKILEFGDTQADLAKAIGISLSNLNAKINGKIDFRQNEIGYIRDRYHLNPVEMESFTLSAFTRFWVKTPAALQGFSEYPVFYKRDIFGKFVFIHISQRRFAEVKPYYISRYIYTGWYTGGCFFKNQIYSRWRLQAFGKTEDSSF